MSGIPVRLPGPVSRLHPMGFTCRKLKNRKGEVVQQSLKPLFQLPEICICPYSSDEPHREFYLCGLATSVVFAVSDMHITGS
jgi:hypothetical protein